MSLQPINARQLDLGAAGFFRAEAEDPPANQVNVKAGSYFRGGFSLLQNSSFPADQTSPGFAVVTPGFQRYDLLAINAAGAAAILQGYEVSLASPAFQGAPGWTGTNPGVRIPDTLIPVAYVLVDETATVLVSSGDITLLSAHRLSRDYDGYLVDKGLFGGAPAGASDVVTTLFAADTRVSSAGGTEPDSGGTATQAGVVTTAPENYVHLLDQNGDEVKHSTGARMYGRLTEAAGVWTLTYFYLNASGVETSMDPSTDTAGPAPTDIQLVGTPRVYSRNDPNRPLFDSNVARLSDQLVGTIPDGSETVKGKVEFAPDIGTAALEAVQGSDTRLAQPIQAQTSAGAAIGARYTHLREPADGSINLSDLGGNVLELAAVGAGKVVQAKSVVNSAQADVLTGAVVIPADNTVPQRAEYAGVIPTMNITIVPQSLSNELWFLAFVNYRQVGNNSGFFHLGLFRDAIASSIANGCEAGQQVMQGCVLSHKQAVASLVSRNYQLYVGNNFVASNISINFQGVLFSGGTVKSLFIILEVAP